MRARGGAAAVPQMWIKTHSCLSQACVFTETAESGGGESTERTERTESFQEAVARGRTEQTHKQRDGQGKEDREK